LSESAAADRAQFRLLDFNEETLMFAKKRAEEAKRRYGRQTPVHLVKKSVHSLLKTPPNPVSRDEQRFDMIYCSGLYDYLGDRVCKMLNAYLYDQLLPGGVLIVTNFHPFNPARHLMEFVFEWFLIHRSAAEMEALRPENASPDQCKITTDLTGCNIFLEVRKPLTK
jgi:extracellular factor (EF) 3-hydroxypalmitic acid methyl ester biosynthesis protein